MTAAPDEDLITGEHVAESAKWGNLSPPYFAGREIAERFMAKFEDEHFKPLAEKFANQFRDQLWGDISAWLLADTESNVGGAIWRMVDQIVQEILSGASPWIAKQYALGERYDCEKVRAALAKTIPKELQDARIADLEAEVAKLEENLRWMRDR